MGSDQDKYHELTETVPFHQFGGHNTLLFIDNDVIKGLNGTIQFIDYYPDGSSYLRQ